MKNDVVDGAVAGAVTGAVPPKARPARKLTKAARAVFLNHLAATAHVIEAATAAGFTDRSAYGLRRRDPAFAHEWRVALLAGYDRIEAALIRKALGCADHAPVVDCAAEGVAPGAGEIDVHVALLLLARHRPTVERAAKDRKEEAFRSTRDAAAATLLAKLKAYAKRADAQNAALADEAAPVASGRTRRVREARA